MFRLFAITAKISLNQQKGFSLGFVQTKMILVNENVSHCEIFRVMRKTNSISSLCKIKSIENEFSLMVSLH